MKRAIKIVLIAIICFTALFWLAIENNPDFAVQFGLASGPGKPEPTAEHEAVSADYGKVIDLAKEEFAEVFKEFEDVQINETTTMTRTDAAKEIVVQFKYSSKNSNGLYGFLYTIDEYGNHELMQHGGDITIDNLIK